MSFLSLISLILKKMYTLVKGLPLKTTTIRQYLLMNILLFGKQFL